MKLSKRKEKGLALQRLVKEGKSKKATKATITKATGQSEGKYADGGAVVSSEIYPDILSPNFAEGSLYSDCQIINISSGRNGIKIPVAAESARSISSIKGGFRAYVVDEAGTKTASKGQFGILDLGLNKTAVVIYATDEILQDAEALSAYMNSSSEEAIIGLLDYSILHGNGLMGAINSSACTGTVSLSDPLTIAELRDFHDAYYGGADGKWYMSKTRFSQVLDLYENVTAGSIMLTFSDGQYFLYGYPIVITDMFLDNEILLADLTQYVVVQKEITNDVNESLKFVEDEKAFRAVLRINGSAIWKSSITVADGSEVYPFVISTGMEASSSSSSESMSSSSSSSEWINHSSSSSSTEAKSSSSSKSSASSQSESSSSSESESSESESSQSSESSSSESEGNESSSSSTDSSDSSDSTNSSESSSNSSNSSDSSGG